MRSDPLILALLAQVLLTFMVCLRLAVRRVGTMRRERIHPQRVADRQSMVREVPQAVDVADNFMNQFETPVLFYLAVLLCLHFGIRSDAIAQLAIGFVALRYVHAGIHLSYNKVLHRFYAFAASMIVLFALWVRIAYSLFAT